MRLCPNSSQATDALFFAGGGSGSVSRRRNNKYRRGGLLGAGFARGTTAHSVCSQPGLANAIYSPLDIATIRFSSGEAVWAPAPFIFMGARRTGSEKNFGPEPAERLGKDRLRSGTGPPPCVGIVAGGPRRKDPDAHARAESQAIERPGAAAVDSGRQCRYEVRSSSIPP